VLWLTDKKMPAAVDRPVSFSGFDPFVKVAPDVGSYDFIFYFVGGR
jgi:hypothetical protein